MNFELVPAVGRQLKAWSTWIALIAGTLDILYLTLESVQSQIDPHTFVYLNAVLIAAIKIATLFKQNIPVTPEQKAELISAAANTPTK